jgi:nucleotide-binding universal stress UspA family protein
MEKQEREMLRVSFESTKDKYAQVAIEPREQMRAALGKLHAEDIQVDYKLREGKPAQKIVKVAEKLGVDLIVMATDGRDNIKDFVTGTSTEHVCALPRAGDIFCTSLLLFSVCPKKASI